MKHKEIRLLSHGLFEKPFMDSKVPSRSVSTKEKILGHLVGPLGLIFVVNTIAALVEKFFTQQTGAMYGTTNADMVVTMGERYEVVITVAKILAVLLGLFNGWLIQHTQSRQGRMRPWDLIFGFVSIVIGCLIFLFPGSTLGESYWYYFFFLLIAYNTVASTFFFLFRDTICSLTLAGRLNQLVERRMLAGRLNRLVEGKCAPTDRSRGDVRDGSAARPGTFRGRFEHAVTLEA